MSSLICGFAVRVVFHDFWVEGFDDVSYAHILMLIGDGLVDIVLICNAFTMDSRKGILCSFDFVFDCARSVRADAVELRKSARALNYFENWHIVHGGGYLYYV